MSSEDAAVARVEALDVEAIAAKWLQVCGACDAGMGPCTHPTDEDYRTPMLALVREVESLRAAARAWEAHTNLDVAYEAEIREKVVLARCFACAR